MAPRSVWNLGLRPQPARPLAGSSHSRAISLPLTGQIARQSHLKSPHEPAASAPASFQQRFARRVGEGKWGGSKRRGVEEEVGRREKGSRAEDWFELAVNQMQPALDFPSASHRFLSHSPARWPSISRPLIGWAPLVTERVERSS